MTDYVKRFIRQKVKAIEDWMESVNIPFIVATKLKPSALKSFAKEIETHYPYVSAKDLAVYIDNYLFDFNVEKERSI